MREDGRREEKEGKEGERVERRLRTYIPRAHAQTVGA